MYAVPRRLLRWPALTWPVCALSILFLLSLPLVNPYVHGDGVGYYAYAQSLVIDHDLNFEDDWRAATPGFLQDRIDSAGNLLASGIHRHRPSAKSLFGRPCDSVGAVSGPWPMQA